MSLFQVTCRNASNSTVENHYVVGRQAARGWRGATPESLAAIRSVLVRWRDWRSPSERATTAGSGGLRRIAAMNQGFEFPFLPCSDSQRRRRGKHAPV